MTICFESAIGRGVRLLELRNANMYNISTFWLTNDVTEQSKALSDSDGWRLVD